MAQTTDTQPIESVPDQLTFWLHNLVDLLRAKTIRPLDVLVRSLIVFAFVAVIGIPIAGALVVGLFRLVNAEAFPGREWATYTLFAGIFFILGLVALGLARPGRK